MSRNFKITEKRAQELMEQYGTRMMTTGNCFLWLESLDPQDREFMDFLIHQMGILWVDSYLERNHQIIRHQILDQERPILDMLFKEQQLTYLPEES